MGAACIKVARQEQPDVIYVNVGGIKFPAITTGSEYKFVKQPDFTGIKTPYTALSGKASTNSAHSQSNFYSQFFKPQPICNKHPARQPYYDSNMTLVVPDMMHHPVMQPNTSIMSTD